MRRREEGPHGQDQREAPWPPLSCEISDRYLYPKIMRAERPIILYHAVLLYLGALCLWTVGVITVWSLYCNFVWHVRLINNYTCVACIVLPPFQIMNYFSFVLILNLI
jgi:hypothetical protein